MSFKIYRSWGERDTRTEMALRDVTCWKGLKESTWALQKTPPSFEIDKNLVSSLIYMLSVALPMVSKNKHMRCLNTKVKLIEASGNHRGLA